ncbi:dynein regulatory complex protein 10 [Xyrauchen texanus]|uniref:dynein regulatory complex protein 10 n=1 Tax=Xyrauchen texanus TaxID=154827 RepID=UPI0022427A25|nr:dynein regulatory complex protein 10 [Xyrauchen texanus]
MGSQSAALSSRNRPSDMLTPAPQKKTKSDFLKIINLPRKTLASLDTQLIFGVLDECVQQMGIVSLLHTLLRCTEALSLSLGEEVVRALKEHQRLGEMYQAVVLDGGLNQGELGEQHAKSKEVQDSFRNILRIFRVRQYTGLDLLKGLGPNTEERMESQKLRDGMCELWEVASERLLTSPAEKRERSQMMREVSLLHHENQELIDSLDKEVAMAIKHRDTEISTLTKKMHQLKSSLHRMEKGLEEFVVRTQQEAEKQSQSDKKTSEGKTACVQEEANQLRAQFKNVIAENRERELALRKKKYKEETEIENWIQKYDAEMGEKQTELEELMNIYEEEKAELTELEEHFAILDLEYSQIMEERQQAQEQREQQERDRELHSQAAIIIQAHWRGFCVRKAMKAKAKPKKGKKGKGKKGK